MNPLEQLRFLARIEGEDPSVLALEACYLLAQLARDRSMLVTALRRLLDRHSDLGIMWMVASRIAGSIFPEDEAWEIVGELSSGRAAADEDNFGLVPHIRLSIDGGITLSDGFSVWLSPCEDLAEARKFITEQTEAVLLLESDLVSSRFAVVSRQGQYLCQEFLKNRDLSDLIICATRYSPVSSSIHDSLRLRLERAGDGGSSRVIIPLTPSHRLSYEGSFVMAPLVEDLVRWRVPQEVLGSAGPMLG